MTEPCFIDRMDVYLTSHMACDADVVNAARVSTMGSEVLEAKDTKTNEGLIKFLMRNRHGTPFEHNAFTFYVSAPIFVLREFQRHRIASYNEESGRYKKLEPRFYIPSPERALVQTGKPGAYEYVGGTPEQHKRQVCRLKRSARIGYDSYEEAIQDGIALEVARMLLPLHIFSSMYVTMNARALMNFLSLRTKHPDSAYPSFPMYEIQMVAEEMEARFTELMPFTHSAFDSAGRVAP